MTPKLTQQQKSVSRSVSLAIGSQFFVDDATTMTFQVVVRAAAAQLAQHRAGFTAAALQRRLPPSSSTLPPSSSLARSPDDRSRVDRPPSEAKRYR